MTCGPRAVACPGIIKSSTLFDANRMALVHFSHGGTKEGDEAHSE
jgi:hypothetical protein